MGKKNLFHLKNIRASSLKSCIKKLYKFFLNFLGDHIRLAGFNPKCNTERGFIDSLYIEQGVLLSQPPTFEQHITQRPTLHFKGRKSLFRVRKKICMLIIALLFLYIFHLSLKTFKLIPADGQISSSRTYFYHCTVCEGRIFAQNYHTYPMRPVGRRLIITIPID